MLQPYEASEMERKTKGFSHLQVGWDQLFEISHRGAQVTHGLTR